MTLLHINGFDHFDTNDFSKKAGWSQNSLPTMANGRFGGQAVSMNSTADYIRYDMGVNKSTIYFGFGFMKYSSQSPEASTSYPFIRLYDEGGTDQIKILLNASHGFNAYRNNTLLGSSSDNVIRSLFWEYIEIKVTISATVGEVTMRVNGTQVLNLTSQNTKNGTDYIRDIRFNHIWSSIQVLIDDFYVDDAQFHGDCRVKIFMPDSDGNSSDFTRSTGSNDYECVDETFLNEDTDYIYSSTLNHKSIFGITTGAVGTVVGIQVNNVIRDDAAGSRKITPIIRSNLTDYSGTETDQIPANYKVFHEVWETDPDDSNVWTQTKLEAAEFGLEITT